jgi:hypothetical protein
MKKLFFRKALLLIAVLLAVFGVDLSPTNAFKIGFNVIVDETEAVHEVITRDGLPFLKKAVIDKIVAENREVDLEVILRTILRAEKVSSSEALLDNLIWLFLRWYELGYKESYSEDHFDNCRFKESSSNINKLYRQIITELNSDAPDEDAIYEAFGHILHTSQDFYAHSNWIELGNDSIVDTGLSYWSVMNAFNLIDGRVMIIQGKDSDFARQNYKLRLDSNAVIVETTSAPFQSFPGLITGSYGDDNDCPGSISLPHGEALYLPEDLPREWTNQVVIQLMRELLNETLQELPEELLEQLPKDLVASNELLEQLGEIRLDGWLPGDLNKDTFRSEQGNLFILTRRLAVLQTRHEFCRLISLIETEISAEAAANFIANWVVPEAIPTVLSPCPTNKLDLMFVIDTTSSMDDDIAAVRANALGILDRIAESGRDWRIGIATYRDHPQEPYGDPGDYPFQMELDFSTDYGTITNAINNIQIAGGADIAESVYAGLMGAIDQPWRLNTRKVIILMGDAPPHDPEPVSGYTLDDVLQAAYNADPISVYPVQIANNPEASVEFQRLADGSSGRLFTAPTASDVVDTLLYTVTSITDNPELAVALTPGSVAEVMAGMGQTLPLRQEPTLSAAVLEELQIGSHVTILSGPEYSDGLLWWEVETDSKTSGWAVQTLDGILALIPLTDDRPILFRDHFYDNRVGWEESLSGYSVVSVIQNGLYTLDSVMTRDFEYWVIAPGFEDWSLAPVFTEPYEVEFRVLDVQSTSGGYGVAVLFDVQENYEPHKRLFINDDGTWQLYRWSGVLELLAEGTLEGGAIDFADRRSHVITLRVDTEQYTLFVDGKDVLHIPGFDPIRGTVGFGVARGSANTGDRIVIRFDDLIVRGLVEPYGEPNQK